MIFVTVGTHEQQFNRLVKYMDEWACKHDEEVIVQTGYSTYEPKYCTWKRLFSFQEMNEKISEARIVITHGGPSSFISPLQIGKTPIVVPRKYEFEEHVNNHQVSFSRAVADRMGTIIVVEEIEKLGETIEKYDDFICRMDGDVISNNSKFCNEFEKIVDEIIKK